MLKADKDKGRGSPLQEQLYMMAQLFKKKLVSTLLTMMRYAIKV